MNDRVPAPSHANDTPKNSNEPSEYDTSPPTSTAVAHQGETRTTTVVHVDIDESMDPGAIVSAIIMKVYSIEAFTPMTAVSLPQLVSNEALLRQATNPLLLPRLTRVAPSSDLFYLAPPSVEAIKGFAVLARFFMA